MVKAKHLHALAQRVHVRPEKQRGNGAQYVVGVAVALGGGFALEVKDAGTRLNELRSILA